MLKSTHKLFHLVLIALAALLILAPAAQAAYNYKMTVTVDGSRVALSAVSPPAGFGFMKCITIDNAKVSGTSNLTDFPVLVSIQNDAALKTTANGGQVTDDQGDDLVFYAPDLTTRLESEVEQYDGVMGTLIAWVRLPELKHDVNTVFYLAYGNDTINDPLGVASAVWDSNFQGVWHLDQDQTGTGAADLYRDSTAGGNHGDDQVSATGKAGQIGAGQQFDGNNDYVNMGNVLDYGKNDPITYSAWIKTSRTMMSIAGKASDINWQGVWFYLEGPNLSLQFYDADTDFKWRGSTQTFNDNQWHHVVASYDGSNDVTGIKLYADGSQLAIGDSGNQILDTVKNSNPFNIGATNNGFDPFDGYIDEVRLSDTVRSADWIATEYNNQNDPGGFMTIEDASPLADFPVLVSILNDAQLKTEANGGQVTDAEGDDIIFTSDENGLSPLNHEVESYDGTTGTLAAWVRLPSLVASEDTVFYMHYGNSAVTNPTETPELVWDSNYRGVWHLTEATDATSMDSTAYSNDGTPSGSPAATTAGKIGSALDFNDTNDQVDIGACGITENHTLEAWVYPQTLGGTNETYLRLGGGGDSWVRHEGLMNPNRAHYYSKINDVNRHRREEGALSDDTWVHLAGSWNGTDHIFYINGQPVDSAQYAGLLYNDPTQGTIGSPTTGPDAIIDEVRISDTARTAGWIKTTYNNHQWPNKAQYPVEGFITVQRGVCDIGAGALPVTCGSTTAGSIETPGGWDAYQVILGADTWLEVYTTGTTDTYGHLYDENCVEIAQDDTVDYNFFISQPVVAGMYYVQVRHASETGTGDYQLSLDCGADDHGDSIDEATSVDCNSSIGGNIESGGDEDYFKVVFWGTGILTAYTTDGSDPSGTLLDEAGNPIAADEDGGAGNNFRISQTVDPGVYYVVVKEKNSGDTGSYTLHVNCEYTPVITASAEYGGTISPVGAVGVTYDGTQSFTITPAAGNTIRDVWVDDRWVGAVSTYEFQNVQTDHKIVAVFNADFENCVDIPDIPLDAWYRSAPANVMFVLDDSGSMDWEFMTTAGDGLFDNYYRYVFDDPGDNLYGRVLPNDRRMKWKSQWAGYNKLYYDPAVTYDPWPNHVAGDAAPTLAPADPDTPRSHPMHAGTTFDLNETFYQYSNDAAANAIIINDQDSEFSKTPEGGGGQTELIWGFEDNNWDLLFEDNGKTKWREDDKQSHSGGQSAMATRKKGGHLTSNDLDAGDLVDGDSISVVFWFRKKKIDAGEFTLSYWNGSGYVPIADLDPRGGDQEWIPYVHDITDDQYFISDFHIRLDATLPDKGDRAWIDDVVIRKNGGAGAWELVTGSDQAYDPDQDGDYWWSGASGAHTATWTPDIPVAGDYDVFARWHADENNSETVPYTVNHDSGTAAVERNQRLNGGEWVLLGTYPFAAGTGGNVSISYSPTGTDDRVCADAVKFVPAGDVDSIDITQAHYYTWSALEDKPFLVVLDREIAYYRVNDANTNDKVDLGEITRATTPPSDVQTGRSYIQERQNFANWYQFYRRRELTATSAVANVIVGLKGVHVGFYSINGNLVQPVLPVKSANIDKSKSLLQALYSLRIRAQGTPLRRGLREVGKYFASSSDMLGSSPYATAENGGACQQAFTIVMTDGFWNGSTPGVGNADGDDNTAFDGGGRADIYTDTLADVAMQYYENDLHAGLDDDIPTSHLDSATHQHMVTYTVSFGRVGSLNPDDYDIANGSYPVWPDPRYVGAHKIDDLWHAAVNGRGEFLSAASPTELVDSLLAISRSIQGRLASSSSVSVNGDPLYNELNEHTRMYQATYRSDSWIGDVSAYQVDAASGEVAATPDWSAADRLATLDWDSGRLIATYDGSQGIPFRYDRNVLDEGQQRALGSDLVPDSAMEQNAVKRLNYLRGDRSNEAQNGGAFRDRIQLLGDIVHSSPVHHAGMLYAGGNDGMLHAIDAESGDEQFAYVPNLVFGNLSYLVDPEYSHKYFVDLSPTVQDITLGGQAKTILVGGLGKGGKGYYALDVTSPADITDEDELVTRVLWEFPDPQSDGRGYLAFDSRIADIEVGDVIKTQGDTAVGKVDAIPVVDGDTGILSLINVGGAGTFQNGDDLYEDGDKVARANSGLYDPYMGYSYSRPVIVKFNDPSTDWLVIFGNGYNSSKSHAMLYIVNPATGELIKRIDTGVGNCNGLSSPIATDIDDNGTVDYVYAGDLRGNLWKFDLTDNDAANWAVAYADTAGDPAPVFQAKNYSGRPQPITSKPDVMYHCSQPGYLVIFGTGLYLTEYDMESSESASIYGIWDYGDDDDHREYLGSFERTATPQLSNPHWVDVESWTRVKLLEQTVEPGTWKTTDGQNLRVITDHTPNWGTVDDGDTDQTDPQPDPGSVTDGETAHAGWYFDLPNVGERVVRDVIIREGKVLVVSFTPGQDPCGSGGNSILHAINACVGARPDQDVFVDIDTVVHESPSGDETTISQDSDDAKEITGIEMAGNVNVSFFLRSGDTDSIYINKNNAEIDKVNAAAAKLGIFYWLQVE